MGIATPPCKLVPSQIMYTGSSAASPTPRLACVHSCKIKGYLYVYIHTVYKHPFACVHSHRRGLRLEGRAGATRTVSERKLTFLSYQLTFLSSKLTFLSSKLTFLSSKLTFLSSKLTFLSSKLTFLSSKPTFLSSQLPFLSCTCMRVSS